MKNDVKNRKKKKKNGTKILVLLWILVFVLIGFELVFKNDVKFIALDYLSRASTNEIGNVKSKELTEVKVVSLDEFLGYGNVNVDESLLLVNDKHKLSENYSPQVVYHEERDVKMNICAKESFDELSKALLEKTEETLFISSAYRDYEKQKEIKEEEGATAQNPGCSEHQTGLALDVFVKNFAGESFIKSESGQFINEVCGDYGFIIRYPIFGEKKTGITYEPWHLRYVGLPHSKIISNSKITLEEYMDFFELGKYYTYENYIITRQNTKEIYVPEKFVSADVSADNTGAVVITFKTTEN
ncbi:MAG: D-alanyl-D-alanine carboxypeptidase family protein [Ruminococcaceae bacterium]|nr:D-alanyl-D-alanine carboxypeptidase family protein [Oscillospiraceae bacterium]